MDKLYPQEKPKIIKYNKNANSLKDIRMTRTFDLH